MYVFAHLLFIREARIIVETETIIVDVVAISKHLLQNRQISPDIITIDLTDSEMFLLLSELRRIHSVLTSILHSFDVLLIP